MATLEGAAGPVLDARLDLVRTKSTPGTPGADG
jgi:hypothetical protein